MTRAFLFRAKRDKSRLMFCLIFAHAVLSSRRRFGPEAGSDYGYDVTKRDLELAVYFLKVGFLVL